MVVITAVVVVITAVVVVITAVVVVITAVVLIMRDVVAVLTTSKLYELSATIIIFVFVLYCIV